MHTHFGLAGNASPAVGSLVGGRPSSRTLPTSRLVRADPGPRAGAAGRWCGGHRSGGVGGGAAGLWSVRAGGEGAHGQVFPSRPESPPPPVASSLGWASWAEDGELFNLVPRGTFSSGQPLRAPGGGRRATGNGAEVHKTL